MGIYLQRQIEDDRNQLRVIQMQVEVEVVIRPDRLFLLPLVVLGRILVNQRRYISLHDVQDAGGQGFIGIITCYASGHEV